MNLEAQPLPGRVAAGVLGVVRLVQNMQLCTSLSQKGALAPHKAC